jgi:hypothetical protein
MQLVRKMQSYFGPLAATFARKVMLERKTAGTKDAEHGRVLAKKKSKFVVRKKSNPLPLAGKQASFPGKNQGGRKILLPKKQNTPISQ